MPQRKMSRSTRHTRKTGYTRSYSRSYSGRRVAPRRKRAVSKRASSARPQRVIIEVRQAPAVVNPLEGLLASQVVSKKPQKARF